MNTTTVGGPSDPDQPIITPAALWLAHRAAAGGKSTITGAPLPATLEDCAVGPQETHYAMACFVATAHGDERAVPIPSKVTTERAAELRADAQHRGRAVAVGGPSDPDVQAA